MHLALVPLEPMLTGRKCRMRDRAAGAWRLHRSGTHERRQTRDGSVACDGVSGFHDGAPDDNVATVTAESCNGSEL